MLALKRHTGAVTTRTASHHNYKTMSSQANEVARLKAELAALQQETASLEKKPKKEKRKKKKRKTTEDDEAAKLRAELEAVDAETAALTGAPAPPARALSLPSSLSYPSCPSSRAVERR